MDDQPIGDEERQTVVASYLWTVEEFLEVLRAHRKYGERARVRAVRLTLLIMLTTVAAVMWLVVPEPAGMVGGGIIAVLSGFLWWVHLIGWESVVRRRYRRARKRLGIELEEKVAITIDADRLRWVTTGTEVTFLWSVVTRVIEAEAGFLVYRGGRIHWLPHHAFRAEDDRARFEALASSCAKSFFPGVARPVEKPAPIPGLE